MPLDHGGCSRAASRPESGVMARGQRVARLAVSRYDVREGARRSTRCGSDAARIRGQALMTVHMTAEYRVRPGSVERCLVAIREFVDVVARDETGTRHYVAWQDERDPVHFL